LSVGERWLDASSELTLKVVVTRTYRATLQVSLHDSPNPLDPVGATDWSETRASEFVPIEVAMTDEVVTRDQSVSLVATRAVAGGAVWAVFVDRWGLAKPVYWEAMGGTGVAAGAAYELAAGSDRLTIGESFAVRNVATAAAGRHLITAQSAT
jgi:hypothetical protein